VAQRAGVSTRTVSIVLNSNGFVSESLTTKVLEAVRELRYRPNNVARSLRRQSTETIGVIVSSILSPFFPPVLKQIESRLFAQGFSMLTASSGSIQQIEALLISLMHDKRVDGLFVSLSAQENLPLLTDMANDDIPVVVIHNELRDHVLDNVAWNNYEGSLAAVRHLVNVGKRRIAIMTSDNPVLMPRFRGYQQALREAGLRPDPRLHLVLAHGDELRSKSVARQAILPVLHQLERPDAIFIAGSDYSSLGVLEGARELGIRIPDDLAIVAYDDFPWMSSLTPPLSTVARDGIKLANIATELFFRRLREKPWIPVETIILTPELIVRGSSNPNV
jgi:LacI family transcriptional regulator